MLKISNRQQALEEICNKFTDEFRVLLLYVCDDGALPTHLNTVQSVM